MSEFESTWSTELLYLSYLKGSDPTCSTRDLNITEIPRALDYPTPPLTPGIKE